MPDKIYNVSETAIQWLASGGDALFTATSLPVNNGVQGAHFTLPATARSPFYAWRAWAKFGDVPVFKQYLDVMLKTSDGTHPDNNEPNTDHQFTSENALDSLDPIGSMVVTVQDSAVEVVGKGVLYIAPEITEVAPVFWNRTDDALSAVAGDHGFKLVPVPFEVQTL